MAHQVSTLTVTEGGIPPVVNDALQLVGASDQASPSTEIARDARIASVPVEQSEAAPEQRPLAPQPADWPSAARGMPVYRPLDRNLDFSIRPMGQNNVEFTFLFFMLGGVAAVGQANSLWRSTIGRVTDRMFRYKIGGTW